jgi:hypothetical protein
MPKLYELLGTKNRKEQEKRVSNLLEMLESPAVCLTVFYYMGVPKFDVMANTNIDSVMVKTILQQTIDEITALEIRDKIAKEALEEQPEPPDEILSSEPLNDSEIPE